MTVAIRADAGVVEGSGHVMRSLTVARAVAARGHRILLAVTVDGLPWLEEVVEETGWDRLAVEPGDLGAAALLAAGADRVVVDSYLIDAGSIGELDRAAPVLAVVDGTLRGIPATLYVEQNLGSEGVSWDVPAGSRMLAGPRYALVRPDVLAVRRPDPWRSEEPARVLVFMGGTDATGAITRIARRLRPLAGRIAATVVAGGRHRSSVETTLDGMPGSRVLAPTPRLAGLYAQADVVVAAAGTSAWEVAALGLPSVLVGVVDNQQASLRAAVDRGLALGVDLVDDPDGVAHVGTAVERLIDDPVLRRRLSERSTALFDGLGAARVAEELDRTGR